MEYKSSMGNMGKKILVTGNEGYIGSVLVPKLQEHGWEVVGLDWGVFGDVEFVPRKGRPTTQISKDVRKVAKEDIEGVEAVIHLAALSDDPVGYLNPELTHEINYASSVKLAKLAKEAGVKRFLFSSSCSVYGNVPNGLAKEETVCKPQTPYAESKVLAEKEIAKLADDNFQPVFLRNATVFGVSPRMRLDLVVQSLAASGYVSGTIEILSDGLPWRPLVHIQDVAEAFCFFLEAPLDNMDNKLVNIGHKENNVQVKTIAETIQKVIPGMQVEIANKRPHDQRSYQVDFSKMYQFGFEPKWTLVAGIEEIYKAFQEKPLQKEDLESDAYITVKRYQKLLSKGAL